MPVTDVSSTNTTSQTSSAEYLASAKTQYDELSTLLNNFMESSNARYVGSALTNGLKDALENLKNLIDSAAEEAFIEEILSKLIALIRGNAQAGIMSIADRAAFLSQLGGDLSNYGGRSSEVTGNYNSIVAILNSDQPITTTQANNLRQALSLSMELENFSSTQHNIDISLIQSLRQGVKEVLDAKGNNVQDKLKILSDIIHGNSEGAISLTQRSAYIGELTSSYNASSGGSKLESLYKDKINYLNEFNVLTANGARISIEMLNHQSDLKTSSERQAQQTKVLGTKVMMEAHRLVQFEMEANSMKALNETSDPNMRAYGDNGIWGDPTLTREENKKQNIIRQEKIQSDENAAERAAQAKNKAQ
ncbi:MAG: hypothetical protein LBJ78_01320 [Puniceicoccales bacterium]|nr:hypothetical protein [Puniceicoccales bacterium]